MPENNPNIDPSFGIVMPQPGYREGAYKLIGPMVAASASRVLPLIHAGLESRNHIPEPFDIPDHIGNTALTFVIAGRMMNGYWGKETELATAQQYERQRRHIAVGVGALSVAANLVGELIGYGSASTPDVVDFAYGLLGGFLAYKLKAPDYVTPDEIAAIRNEKEPSKLKEAVETLFAVLRPNQETSRAKSTRLDEGANPSAQRLSAPLSRSAKNIPKNSAPRKQKAQKAARRKNRHK